MEDVLRLGKTYELSNGQLTRIDIDDDHYYFIKNENFPEGQFCASVTGVIDKAGPVPEGLREFWKNNTKQESEELLHERGKRGSKLHSAFEDLLEGLEVQLKEFYPTTYEKAAIVSFIRFFRFLEPTAYKSELIVASSSLVLAGTLDFIGLVDKRRLDMLVNPIKFLGIDADGNFAPKIPEMLDGEPEMVKIVIDWKTSSGIHYAHEKQVIAYREMYNESYANERKVTHCGIMRISTRHKHGFEFKLVEGEFEGFKRLYDTYLDINNGQLPKPPNIVIYPEKVKLIEAIDNEIPEDKPSNLRQTVEVS